jgi:3-oxoacyl-[acyl-carrier protein] reductase
MLERVLDAAPDRDKLQKALADAHPLKRLGTAEEIAELMLYLACDRSAYVTGAVFSIDGGITAACPVASF